MESLFEMGPISDKEMEECQARANDLDKDSASVVDGARVIRRLLMEIRQLREILKGHHLDPDRCHRFPTGSLGHAEQCGLRRLHPGSCKWNGGD